MTKPVSTKPQNTQDKILDVAEAQFSAKGYAGTRLDEIAKIVDIKRPSLLYHFSNKGELYIAILDRLFEPQLEIIETVLDQNYDSELEKLEAITRHWIAWAIDNPHYTSMLMHHAASKFQDEFSFWERSSNLVNLLEDTLKKGIKKGEIANITTASLFSLISGYTAFYLVMAKESDEQSLSNNAIDNLTTDLMFAVTALLKPKH